MYKLWKNLYGQLLDERKVLMEQNAVQTPQVIAPARDGVGVSPKEQLLKQFTEGGGGEGGLFKQLAGNPFFTAVC